MSVNSFTEKCKEFAVEFVVAYLTAKGQEYDLDDIRQVLSIETPTSVVVQTCDFLGPRSKNPCGKAITSVGQSRCNTHIGKLSKGEVAKATTKPGVMPEADADIPGFHGLTKTRSLNLVAVPDSEDLFRITVHDILVRKVGDKHYALSKHNTVKNTEEELTDADKLICRRLGCEIGDIEESEDSEVSKVSEPVKIVGKGKRPVKKPSPAPVLVDEEKDDDEEAETPKAETPKVPVKTPVQKAAKEVVKQYVPKKSVAAKTPPKDESEEVEEPKSVKKTPPLKKTPPKVVEEEEDETETEPIKKVSPVKFTTIRAIAKNQPIRTIAGAKTVAKVPVLEPVSDDGSTEDEPEEEVIPVKPAAKAPATRFPIKPAISRPAAAKPITSIPTIPALKKLGGK